LYCRLFQFFLHIIKTGVKCVLFFHFYLRIIETVSFDLRLLLLKSHWFYKYRFLVKLVKTFRTFNFFCAELISSLKLLNHCSWHNERNCTVDQLLNVTLAEESLSITNE
jgi:hypothetical protein